MAQDGERTSPGGNAFFTNGFFDEVAWPEDGNDEEETEDENDTLEQQLLDAAEAHAFDRVVVLLAAGADVNHLTLVTQESESQEDTTSYTVLRGAATAFIDALTEHGESSDESQEAICCIVTLIAAGATVEPLDDGWSIIDLPGESEAEVHLAELIRRAVFATKCPDDRDLKGMKEMEQILRRHTNESPRERDLGWVLLQAVGICDTWCDAASARSD